MADKSFREPHIALSRIYTRGGDGGETALVNGRRVRKDDPRVEAYGAIDELNAFVGSAVAAVRVAVPDCAALASLEMSLLRVQNELFNLGSEIATDAGAIGPQQPRILPANVTHLEAEMDAMNEDLPTLGSFVLPGGTSLNAALHVCRAVCRRAERRLVALSTAEGQDLAVPLRYLNRLSDAFFVWSRWACRQGGAPETLWQANSVPAD